MPLNLRKALVVALLAWAMLDMAVPSLCPSDSWEIESLAGRSELSLVASTSQSESPVDGPVKSHYEDDCFCCCGHIVPAVPVLPLPAWITSVGKTFLESDRVLVISAKYFHPPRA